MAALTLDAPNLLVMDEPTNNLDLDGVHALEIALNRFVCMYHHFFLYRDEIIDGLLVLFYRYNGSVVLVSHDMSFVQRVVDDDKVYLLSKKSFRRLSEGVSEFRAIVDSAIEKLE